MIDPEDPLVHEAVFGQVVENFLQSDVGIYLLTRAGDEIEEGRTALCRCDPLDSKKIVELQNLVWRAESVREWLADAIQRGHNAREQLEESHGS